MAQKDMLTIAKEAKFVTVFWLDLLEEIKKRGGEVEDIYRQLGMGTREEIIVKIADLILGPNDKVS